MQRVSIQLLTRITSPARRLGRTANLLLVATLMACGPAALPQPTATSPQLAPAVASPTGNSPLQPAGIESPTMQSPLPSPSENPDAAPWITPPPGTEALVARAIQLLKETHPTEVGGRRIYLIAVESAQWQDSSLGCPRAGMQYRQAVTPGYRIVLEAAGTHYEVHSDAAGSTLVLCEAGQ
jgi:hypothetical protein